MLQTTPTEAGKRGKPGKTPEYRAIELARETLVEHGDTNNSPGASADKVIRAAFGDWLPQIEADPEMMIAVIGRPTWEQIAIEFLRKIMLSERGRAMSKAGHETHGFKPAKRSDESLVRSVAVELGILGTVMIGEKQLWFCTKAEVVAEQGRSKSRAEFLGGIVELLPSDDAVVKNFVTPEKAKTISAAVGLE